MAEALPPASTTRRGVNPSKFMGASFAAGSNLSDTVFNNSKKIEGTCFFEQRYEDYIE